MSPDFLAFYSMLPIQANALPSKWLSWSLSYSDCPWMVPVADCGVMAASLWDKQPLRKGRTITNQCVQLPDDTQRTCVEAASHFTPKAFWRKRSSLKGWVNGCFLMEWLWLTTVSITYKWWDIQLGIMGIETLLLFVWFFFCSTLIWHFVVALYIMHSN